MSTATRFSALLAFAIAVTSAAAQAPESTFPATPLASKHYAYPTGIPYKVDTDTNLIRGQQYGYNQCNSTTENQQSLCQTSMLNSLDDFCLWAPDPANSTVADMEGEMVAWCTKPGRGTRLIPAGALQGVQFMRTPDYVQVVGFIDQTQVHIAAGDWGGELDPHGADLRGNPMGGLMYSNAWSGSADAYTQVIEWHNFMGGNAFCLKACDPAGPNAAKFCQHIYDRIGCAYNAPNNAQNGTFESCLGDNQDFPGIYTENGVVMTYTQPAEALGVISTMPYQPNVPASSSCTPFTSAVLYSAIASVTGDVPVASATTTSGAAATSGASSGTSKPASSSKTSSGAAPAKTDNGASTVAASSLLAIVGVAFSAIFFS